MLVVKLTALIEDLRSVGAAPGEVEPLTTLLDALTKLHAVAPPAAFEDETEKILLAFVNATAAPPAEKKSRLAFWK
jgi:hypothetical protein